MLIDETLTVCTPIVNICTSTEASRLRKLDLPLISSLMERSQYAHQY